MDLVTAAGLVEQLVASRRERPLVVAMDGASAAGTTTLAVEVGRRLATGVVSGDDFYRDMPEDQRWRLSAAQGVDQYFDWQRLRRDALEPLRAGRPARYHPFDWRAGAGLARRLVEVPATPVVLVEGVYSARPELRDVVDVAVLVETPADERRRRLLARGHDDDAWWPRWNAAEDLYYATIRPRASYDLVVPGN